MSRRVNISYFFSIILLLLTGCEQEASLAPSPNGEEPVEILLNAQVVQASTSITRNDFLDNASFNAGAQIGLFGLRHEGASFTDNPYLNNITFTNNNGSLTGDEKIYFPAGKTIAYLYGYYPYTANDKLYSLEDEVYIPIKSGFSGTADDLWTDASTDPLHVTAAPTIIRANADSESATTAQVKVPLSFKHMMAQLRVNITTKNPDYQLQELIITFRAHQHGYMNVRNGIITSANSDEERCVETFNDLKFINATDAQSIHSVLPGSNAITSIQVKVKTDGEVDGAVYEAFNAKEEGRSIDLTAGNITRVIIEFNPSNTTQTTLNNAWNTSEEHSIKYN